LSSRLPHICCPHCKAKAFARTGGKKDSTYREVYYHCSDEIGCGHVFVVAMEAIRTVRQSLFPNPAVHLPVTPPEMLRGPTQGSNTNVRTQAQTGLCDKVA
jgi:hypothetical protein